MNESLRRRHLPKDLQPLKQRAPTAEVSSAPQADAPAAQVSAEGAGYLAPRASNLTPAGRLANRRVEAVLLP